MRKFLKIAIIAALVLCVGLPLAGVAFILVMAALGVALGIGGAILGLLLAVVKFALLIGIPILLVWWVATRLFSRERTY